MSLTKSKSKKGKRATVKQKQQQLSKKSSSRNPNIRGSRNTSNELVQQPPENPISEDEHDRSQNEINNTASLPTITTTSTIFLPHFQRSVDHKVIALSSAKIFQSTRH